MRQRSSKSLLKLTVKIVNTNRKGINIYIIQLQHEVNWKFFGEKNPHKTDCTGRNFNRSILSPVTKFNITQFTHYCHL